jgi:hypothetical protein
MNLPTGIGHRLYHVAEYVNEAGDIISSNDAEKEAWLYSRCHDLKHKPKTASGAAVPCPTAE